VVKQNLYVPYTYNISSTLQYAENIQMVTQPTYKMITLDITSLYTNIPNPETLGRISTKLQNSTQRGKELQVNVTAK
jgi:hypothetical protein